LEKQRRAELNTEQKTELKERLATLDARARKDLIRQAATLRGRSQVTGAKEAKRPVEWFMLHLLQKEENRGPLGIVIGVDRTRCIVRMGGEDRPCRAPEGLAPGDQVHIANDAVTEVLPRRTTLMRKEGGSHRLIAANVDVVVVVVSVVAPPLHPRLIDRYLAAIQQGGADAAVCLNKSDLGISEEDELAIDTYRTIVPVFETSAEAGRGLAGVREFLGDRLSVFVGHSGVGKSSLLNALIEEPVAAAGTVSEDTGKGRHTTTRSTLHESAGLRILDTPGIREFGVGFESPREVAEGFVEIARLGEACRYPDCLHLEESRFCAVREGLQFGAIRQERYESYVKLLAEAFPRLLDKG
jgi:ribosome biogenesis GTPase / thiamine phosphate phosphatase